MAEGEAAPTHIGRYRVEAELGRGAMGVVYRAHDPEIDRRMAIKLVRADLLAGDARAEYLARFRREAQAAGRCIHPNIVAVYDFAMHDGNPFLAMEYVDGVTLAHELGRGRRFGPGEAVAIVIQVLQALTVAHGLGVVHRDIKPANVLLVRGGDEGGGDQVKVMDFGISRLADSDLTQGGVVGTPSTMSPEQCRGEAVDARSDLFSVGVLLFELLTGEKPFPGRGFAEIVTRLLHHEPPPLRDLLPAAPAWLAAAVQRALAKSPQQRFATAAAMIAALQGAGEQRSATPAPGGLVSGDQTVLQSWPASAWLPDALDRVQRELAQYLGPIARRLVVSASRQAATPEALCDTLAGHLASAADRTAFLAKSRRALRQELRDGDTPDPNVPGRSAPLGQGIPAEAVAAVQAALSQAMGPIARILVKRALAQAGSVEELWALLAQHIDPPAERQAFMARRVK